MKSKKCFIICPIGVEGTDIRKRSDTVYDYFLKPICEGLGYDIIRSDKITSSDRIDTEIIKYLDSSELVVADLTDLNANVFYEIGYRKAKGLPCVHIALEGTELPFDVTTVRTQFYSITDIPKSENFKENLKKVIQDIESRIKPNDMNNETMDENFDLNQETLDRIYNLEDSLQSLYDMVESSFENLSNQIDKNFIDSDSSYENRLIETFLKEAIKNPTNAKRFINQFQDTNPNNKK